MFKTLKDEWELDKSRTDKIKKYLNPKTNLLSNNPRVQCDCGVHVPMDMMVDMRPVPKQLKYDKCPDFVCDGCYTKLLLTDVVTSAEIASYLTDDVDEVIRLNERDQLFNVQKDSNQKKVKVGKV